MDVDIKEYKMEIVVEITIERVLPSEIVSSYSRQGARSLPPYTGPSITLSAAQLQLI